MSIFSNLRLSRIPTSSPLDYSLKKLASPTSSQTMTSSKDLYSSQSVVGSVVTALIIAATTGVVGAKLHSWIMGHPSDRKIREFLIEGRDEDSTIDPTIRFKDHPVWQHLDSCKDCSKRFEKIALEDNRKSFFGD